MKGRQTHTELEVPVVEIGFEEVLMMPPDMMLPLCFKILALLL